MEAKEMSQLDLFSEPLPEFKGWSDLKWMQTDECSRILDSISHVDYCPRDHNILRFMDLPFDHVRVVILGQDPYPNPKYACGLAFSIPANVHPLPPSLLNIFLEVESDMKCKTIPLDGSLQRWVDQGVLLLNTVLTVEVGNSNSHRGIGWEALTTEVIQALVQYRESVVFMLWGQQAFKSFKNATLGMSPTVMKRHHMVVSAHPSPLSAHHGFLGSKPFSRANSFLKVPIRWCP